MSINITPKKKEKHEGTSVIKLFENPDKLKGVISLFLSNLTK